MGLDIDIPISNPNCFIIIHGKKLIILLITSPQTNCTIMESILRFLTYIYGQNNLIWDNVKCTFTIKVNGNEDILCYYNDQLIEKMQRCDSYVFVNFISINIRQIIVDVRPHPIIICDNIDQLSKTFSRESLFIGCILGNSEITTVGTLHEILEKEWEIVSENILAKYKLFKCVMLEDVALRIMQIVCLLGIE